MIKLGQKIKTLISEAGYKKPGLFYKELCNIHEKEVITPKTFYSVLHDRFLPRERTLFQLSTILGINTTELRRGTNHEIVADPDAKKISAGQYSYNDKAHLYGYHVKAPFMPLRLHLKAGGATPEDWDAPDVKESVKLVWMIVGKITVVIKVGLIEEKHQLHNGQMLSFDARKPHYFVNDSKTNSVAHIIHYPAENNGLYVP